MNATSIKHMNSQCDVDVSRSFGENTDKNVVPMVNKPFRQCELVSACRVEKHYKHCFDLLNRCYSDAEPEILY